MTANVGLSVERKEEAPWSVAQQLQARTNYRNDWETNFETNYQIVADTISQAISTTLFQEIRLSLLDVYKPLPTTSHPLTFNYSLSLQKATATIKAWSKESAELPPFNEWFATFQTNNSQQNMDEASSSSLRFHNKELEIGYFQELMSKIGHLVEANLSKNLQTFRDQPENQNFRYTVQWYRKAEQLIPNPSQFDDNYVSVSGWIVDPQGDTQTASQKTAPRASRCIKRLPQCTIL